MGKFCERIGTKSNARGISKWVRWCQQCTLYLLDFLKFLLVDKVQIHWQNGLLVSFGFLQVHDCEKKNYTFNVLLLTISLQLYHPLSYLLSIQTDKVCMVRPVLITSFCSMKWLGVFLPPLDEMLVHCRVTSSIKLTSCLVPARAWTQATQSWGEHTNHKVTMPQHPFWLARQLQFTASGYMFMQVFQNNVYKDGQIDWQKNERMPD